MCFVLDHKLLILNHTFTLSAWSSLFSGEEREREREKGEKERGRILERLLLWPYNWVINCANPLAHKGMQKREEEEEYRARTRVCGGGRIREAPL